MSLELPRLLLLTDRSQLPLGRSLVSVVERCVEAGLTHVVVRELDESEPARTALAAALTEVGATVLAARTPLYSAAGVHLAATQVVPAGLLSRTERLTSPGGDRWAALPWGRSCHSATEVHVAGAAGAGWATLGPFAATASKPGYSPIERDEYAVAGAAGIPVYALGGVTPDNAVDAIAAGADGLAVMGTLMRAPDPGSVVRELLEIVEDAPW